MLIHVSKQNLLLPWYFFLKISSEIYLHGSEFLSSTLWAPNTFLCGAQPRYLLGEALCAFRPYQYSLLPSCVYVCARARTLFFQPTPALQRACEMTAVAWQTAVKRRWTGVGEEGYFQYLTVIPRQRRSSLQIWGSIFSFRSPALRPDRSPRCPRERQRACSPLILSVCYPHRLKLSWSPACACVYACAHE